MLPMDSPLWLAPVLLLLQVLLPQNQPLPSAPVLPADEGLAELTPGANGTVIGAAAEEDSSNGNETREESRDGDGDQIAQLLLAPDSPSADQETTISAANGSSSIPRAILVPAPVSPVAPSRVTTVGPVDGGGWRLPDWISPVQYQLRLTLDSETEIVQGQVQVQLECVRPSALLRLHLAPDFLSVAHVLLEPSSSAGGSQRPLAFRAVSIDWRRQQLELRLARPLERGQVYQLGIWFSARPSTDGRGLTRRRDKRSLWLNTLFEPFYARRLFPCWDEPRFRASFRLELWLLNALAGDNYVALSATEARCQRWHANLSICQFEPSPPIPVYLFSLAVGPFRAVCNGTTRAEVVPGQQQQQSAPGDICIWRLAQPGEPMAADWEHTARDTIRTMAKFQAAMVDYLSVVPAARLHLLVVPMKTINGMENWGLLNIRDTLWPLPNGGERLAKKFRGTLYHEMVHQWFGNLVTVHWWDDIWLAESLTTFLASPRPLVFDPSHDLSESALVDDSWVRKGKGGRSLNSIPGIAYFKGAALMEMLEALIGAQRMRRLLREFVRLFQFRAASTGDFLALLGQIMAEEEQQQQSEDGLPVQPQHSPVPAVHFLDRWLRLPSHPIVFVDFDARLGLVLLSQTPKMGPPSSGWTWPIPVWVECTQGTLGEQLFWMSDQEGGQLVLPLDSLTLANSTGALAFNRNHPVYYQLTVRVQQQSGQRDTEEDHHFGPDEF